MSVVGRWFSERIPVSGSQLLEITNERARTESLAIVMGREEPRLGWHSPAFLEVVPSPTIVIERRGTDVLAATVIRLRGDDDPPVRDLVSILSATSRHVRWGEGATKIELIIPAGAPLDVQLKIENP